VQEVRAIAENLRPPALGPFGIAAALETLAERIGEQHPYVTVIADVEAGGVEPEGDVPLALFRIAQEALNNAVEHADPSVIVLRYRPAPLHLEVTDDGSGFAWPRDLGALRRDGHFGILGIAERVELIGGKLSVTPGPRGGTRLRVTR
jgi:signal transduction histidine kinase